jgi:hypothetical protein
MRFPAPRPSDALDRSQHLAELPAGELKRAGKRGIARSIFVLMNPIAIIIAGALIAAAIAFTNHWQISAADTLVFRLDRWSGDVVVCGPTTANGFALIAGAKRVCENRDP